VIRQLFAFKKQGNLYKIGLDKLSSQKILCIMYIKKCQSQNCISITS